MQREILWYEIILCNAKKTLKIYISRSRKKILYMCFIGEMILYILAALLSKQTKKFKQLQELNFKSQ